METGDCVVIDVAAGDDTSDLSECPLCRGDINNKQMKNTCRKNIAGHNICSGCYTQIASKYSVCKA